MNTPDAADQAATPAPEGRVGPRSPKVKFAKMYDHDWPSGAVTNYPAGYEGRVKTEVAEAAERAGVLEGKPVADGDETK